MVANVLDTEWCPSWMSVFIVGMEVKNTIHDHLRRRRIKALQEISVLQVTFVCVIYIAKSCGSSIFIYANADTVFC